MSRPRLAPKLAYIVEIYVSKAHWRDDRDKANAVAAQRRIAAGDMRMMKIAAALLKRTARISRRNTAKKAAASLRQVAIYTAVVELERFRCDARILQAVALRYHRRLRLVLHAAAANPRHFVSVGYGHNRDRLVARPLSRRGV